MHETGHNTKTWKEWISSPLGILILVGVFTMLTVSLVRMVMKYRIAMNNSNAYIDQLGSLHEQEQHLQEKLRWLSTPEGQEYELRDRYGVAKPGEEVIIITE